MEEERALVLLSSLQNCGVSVPNDAVLTDPDTLVSICAQCLNLIHPTAPFPVTTTTGPGASTVDRLADINVAVKRLGFLASDITYYQLLPPSEEECYKLVRFLVERLTESSSASSRSCVDRNVEELGEKEGVGGDKHNAAPTMLNGGAENASSGGKILTPVESSKGNDAVKQTQKKEEGFEELRAKTLNIKHLEEELELLKAAASMVSDDQHSIDFYLKQLDEEISVKKSRSLELDSQWDSFRKLTEEKKRIVEDSLYATLPGAQEKLQKLRDVEQENHHVLSEISMRDVQISRLSLEIEQQPKLPSRASYVERIKEITKNSRKQEADIEHILKDTRKLQLESNSIQERLDRTYAVLDEIVYREAKKDSVGRQAYRLLTSIHENFEQVSEKILTTDRVRREVLDLEKKLAALSSRRVDVDKLNAGLGSVMKENGSVDFD